MRCARCGPSRAGSSSSVRTRPPAKHAHTAREHADARWREADDWITSLRGKIVN